MNPRVFIFALLAAASGCRGPKSEGSAPAPSASETLESGSVELSLTLTPEQKQRADAILASLDERRWSFGAKEASEPQSRPALLTLAATTDTAKLPQVGAALQALAALPPEKAPSADLLRLVEVHLGTRDQKIHQRALELARKSAGRDKESRQLADVIMSFGERPEFQRGVGRYLVVDTVRAFPPGVANRKRLAALLTDSLDARDSEVAVQALDALVELGRFAPERRTVIARALALSVHTNPLVRGKGLELVGELDQDHRRALQTLAPAVEDESAFVRAMACKGMQRLGEKAAIHAMMKLVDDDAKTSGEMSLQAPEGGALRTAFPTGPFGLVQESALAAVHHLSGRAFERAPVTPTDPKAGFAKQAKAAKQWYEKAKKDLPSFPAGAGPTPEPSAAPSGAAASEAPKAQGERPAPKTAPVKATLPAKPSAAPAASP